MFTTRIENVARHSGFHIQWIEQASQIGELDLDAPRETPGESLYGRRGQLFTKLADWQPALLLFDLTNEAIPWRQWIPALKSSPATRRMPIMCFGPHEDVARMSEAKRLGADVVLARSRFTADMATLFQRYANIPDLNILQESCQEPLSAKASKGLQLFNEGEYFECHEELEDAWNEDQGPGRDLYRGILQVAVAYLQIERGNYRGAIKMLLRVRQWLDPLPDICRGINIAQLRRNAQAVHDTLLQLGPERLSEFDLTSFKKVEYKK
jgi:predicted metal-dependent hydrolase